MAAIHNCIFNSGCDNIKLMLVPSHVGISFNEKADLAAKAAVRFGQETQVKLTVEEGLEEYVK